MCVFPLMTIGFKTWVLAQSGNDILILTEISFSVQALTPMVQKIYTCMLIPVEVCFRNKLQLQEGEEKGHLGVAVSRQIQADR